MDIIKNPVVIGMFAGLGTYVYQKYNTDERNAKRRKKNKKAKLEEVNLVIPLLVTLIVWFIAYAYLESDNKHARNVSVSRPNNSILNMEPAGYRFTNDALSESSDPKSFSLLLGGGGVTVPHNLPDVYIE